MNINETTVPPVFPPASTIDINCSVNDTVLKTPETLTVFAEYGLDTCCRGAMSIRDAAADAHIDVAQLAADLHAVTASGLR